MELSEQPLAVNKMLYNSGFMWPSVVVHEHWPVSQRMIVETTPDSYTPTPKISCAQNVVVLK